MKHRDEATEPVMALERDPHGIVIRDRAGEPRQPRIIAFIWGGRTQPLPTLPFGRWKPSAA